MASDHQPTAWITGASQGLGKAVSWRLCELGWHVIATARNEEWLQQLSNSATQEGLSGRITALPADITDNDSLQKLDGGFQNQHIDLVILNAGTHRHQQLIEGIYPLEDARTLININLLGTLNCLGLIMPHLYRRAQNNNQTERHQPQLAIVASLAGYRGLPTASAYGATKAALINLTESLRLDLHHAGIDVRLINPGFVDTPLTAKNPFPMPDIISAEKAALYIIEGLGNKGFEIRFPPRFARIGAILRRLPYCLYFPLVRKFTGKKK